MMNVAFAPAAGDLAVLADVVWIVAILDDRIWTSLVTVLVARARTAPAVGFLLLWHHGFSRAPKGLAR
jgi:hypothetical protein